MRASIGVGLAALLTTAACSGKPAGPALTADEVKKVFAKTQPTCTYTWTSIQIAASRQASAGESVAAGMPPRVAVTPVRVEYSAKCGFTRDYRWNYYFYKDDFGQWTKQSNATTGNWESEPR